MTRAVNRVFLCSLLIARAAAVAHAQPPGKPTVLDCETKEFVDQRWLCKGQVRFEQGDVELYTDELEYFEAEHRVIALGNVTFKQGRNQINADHADFNTETRVGKFFVASGVATTRTPRQSSVAPGTFVAPQLTGQQTEVYFFGEIVEKVGPKKYKITNGGFTTCVQPTPRWEFHSGSITVNVDDYTLLYNTVFNVKGVPLLYVPIVYYPTNEENRSTGFLLPTYGTSTLNGKTIGNQFFWAVDRSHDVTFMHDWYSKLGQGGGAEYRYNLGSGAGHFATYMLKPRREAVTSNLTSSDESSFFFVGAASQRLPRRFRAQARANYPTNMGANQILKTNLADLGLSRREFGGNVSGGWGRYSVNAMYQRTEWFTSLTSSGISGQSPQVSISQSEQQLTPTAPIYFAFNGDYGHLDHQVLTDEVVTDDRTLTRIDFFPRVRYPLKRWQWVTIDSSASWRNTFYSRSQEPAADSNTFIVTDNALNRQFLTVQSDIKGPVFNRVWDTPESSYAEKFKHTIEPYFTVAKTTTTNDSDRVVSGVDNPTIGTTRYSYGLNNRLQAKRKSGQSSQAQEIASLVISQSYYTDSRAASNDPNYATSFSGSQPSHFTPVRVDLRVNPTTRFSGTTTAEIDPTHRELRSLSARATHSWFAGSTDVTWSQKFFIEDLVGFSDPNGVSRTLAVSSSAHTIDNRLGGTYSITYDALRTTIIQQTMQGYYSAQCCGFSFQYLRRSFPTGFSSLSGNTQFLFTVTLAGLGSVSPFSGGLGGLPR